MLCGGTYEEITTNIPPADEATHSVSLGEVKNLLKKIKINKATHSGDYLSWIRKECAEDHRHYQQYSHQWPFSKEMGKCTSKAVAKNIGSKRAK